MNRLRKLWKFIDDKLELDIMLVFYATLSIAVLLQIVTRIFKASFSWTEETARFCYIWLCAFGLGLGKRYKTHIRVDFIYNLFRGKALKVVNIFMEFVQMVAWLYILYICIDFIPFIASTKAPALQISMVFVGLAVPAGMIVSIFRCIEEIVHEIKTFHSTEGNKPSEKGGE